MKYKDSVSLGSSVSLRMRILTLLVLVLLCQLADAQHGKSYMIMAPKVFRLAAQEAVAVQLFGYSEEVTMELVLKSAKDHNAVIYDKASVILNTANSHQADAKLHVPPDKLIKDATHLVLQATSNEIHKSSEIPVTRRNGHLFIQTDKPLYTPEQSVKVRVFALREDLTAASWNVFLTFRDPYHEIMDTVELNNINGIPSMQDPFKIPLKPRLGVWSIEASYREPFITTARTEFEVKEYVLPSIGIMIQPEANFISHGNFDNFPIKITARYMNGAAVSEAIVYLRFGYVSKNGAADDPVILPRSIQRGRMTTNGVVEMSINMKKALSAYDGPRDLRGLKDKFLYTVVSVSEPTGGLSQEAELATVKFMEAPYSLSLVATPPFIRALLPYIMRVVVKDHLGEPVTQVPVRLVQAVTMDTAGQSSLLDCGSGTTQHSGKDGIAYFICNMPPKATKAEIKFRTEDSNLPKASQTEFVLRADGYSSRSGRYLYINMPFQHTSLEVGSYTDIEVLFQSPSYLKLPRFSYLVITKGKIVHFATVESESSTRLRVRFQVKPEMVPSFRLLVYYILYGDLVADSVWMSVNAKCINNLKTELTFKETGGYKPNQEVHLQVKTGNQSLVALSAVDTALYNLRVKPLDPVTKVLRHIEQADLGCGGGGGKDNADVFRLAGLTLMTNADASPKSSKDEKCDALVRTKRSASPPTTLEEWKVKILGYRPYHRICLQGWRYHPQYDSCAQRARQIQVGDDRSREVFLECCLLAQQYRPGGLILARSSMEIDLMDDLMPNYVRSYFPEAWLWEVHTVKSEDLTLPVKLPDSLTTWEFRAVAMYPNGLCVATPQQISVSQLVSVDVPLPYSMVRGEQIELQGSVYNQAATDLRYCVTLTAGPGVCLFQADSSSAAGEKTTACKMTRLQRDSVGRVSFTLLALEAGSHPLTFKVKTSEGNLDTVKKNLRVVPEGILTEDIISNKLDPEGIYGRKTRQVQLDNKAPRDQVPHTTVDRELTISGEILGEVLSTLMDTNGLEKVLRLPRGTPEVEVFRALSYFYVFQLLETRGSWSTMVSGDPLSPTQVKNRIKQGLISITSFRKIDGSYSLASDKKPSTWLTALVVSTMGKVFSTIDLYATTDYVPLQNSVSWLVRKMQNPLDGSFKESSTFHPVKVMRARGDKLEQSVYLTSFVLIGLINVKEVKSKKLKLQEFADSRTQAANYISQHATGHMSMYVRAVAAYSLLLHDFSSIEGSILYDQLENQARTKGDPVDLRYWEERPTVGTRETSDQLSPQTVEITCYVLLSSLLKGKTTYARPIVSWLTKDQHYLGGFQSIQEVGLVLQALTTYDKQVKGRKLDMEINISYIRGSYLPGVTLNQHSPVARPIKVEDDKAISLSTGFSTGVTVNKLKTVYYKLTESSQNCNFDISINVLGPDQNSHDPRRQTPRISACAKFKPPPGETVTESGLTRMEIQLPTGVEASTTDLDLQLNGFETVMSEYQLDGDTLIIWLPEVPSDRSLCVAFRIHDTFKVGMASDSQFRVFENQDRGSICSQRYSPLTETKIQRLCVADECRCMSAECSTFKKDLSRTVTPEERVQETCASNVKYAFKMEIKSSAVEGDFVIYMGKVLVDLKTDEKEKTENFRAGTELEFIKKATCDSVDLKTDAHYLIMASDKMRIQVDKSSFKYRFILDAQALVEIWPATCGGDSVCSRFLEVLKDYELDSTLFGCP